MGIYQFHFLGPNGERPALDFEDCLDDGGAARSALAQLGRHDSCIGVEVWQDERLVLRHVRSDNGLQNGTAIHGGSLEPIGLFIPSP